MRVQGDLWKLRKIREALLAGLLLLTPEVCRATEGVGWVSFQLSRTTMAAKKPLDPDSFKGKVSLLIIDKIVLGSIIALALVIYDAYRREDDRKYQERVARETRQFQETASRVQLDFERARLAREFLPNIFDREGMDVAVRGYLLRSGVVTGSIDAEAAVTILSRLQSEGLTDQDFLAISRSMLPSGIAATARRGAELLSRHSQVHAADGSFLVADYSVVKDEMERLEHEQRLWRTALRKSWASNPRDPAFAGLESTAFLGQHLEALYFLLAADSYTDALELSHTPSRGLRLLGYLHRLKSDSKDREALTGVTKELRSDSADPDDIYLSRSVLQVLMGQFPRASGSAAEPVARVVIAERPKIRSVPDLHSAYEIEADFFSLQWSAAEALFTMATKGPAIVRQDSIKAAEPTLLVGLARLRDRLERIDPTDTKQLEEVAQQYESGKLIRMIVAVLAERRSPEATQELQALLFTGPNRLRPFPFLEEDLKRALSGASAAPGN